MALNAAEEETVEELKKWWDENGKQLAAMVILVLAGYTGWLLWQNSNAEAMDTASDIYEQILTLGIVDPGVEIGESVASENSDRIIQLADQLKSEHGGTVYALFASLFSAQQQVRANDLSAAESSLQWIIDNQQDDFFGKTDEGLILTTNLRLGRVILAQGDNQRALGLVNTIDPKSFEAGYAELRGDIYADMERYVDALDAYVTAQQAGSNSNSLRMKLDNLADEG